MVRTEPMKVLFVCTGNICRSPVAERILAARSAADGLGLEVSSAGTRALNGDSMHPESERVLRARGINPGAFQSRMLTPAIVGNADLVLGLTRDHRAAARQLLPIRWKKMFALREVALSYETHSSSVRVGDSTIVGPSDPALDIADPIGRSAEFFDRVTEEIEASMDALVAWIAASKATTT